MNSILFWNRPSDRELPRSVDPLGFDALREAMADKLVPLLTGATRNADEYLWTLIGLRWAREATGSPIDATIFNQGFALFERALKQYWYKYHRRVSGGINVVSKICAEAQPDVRRTILVDQRATGLLGSYIVSLRGMGLIEKASIRVFDDASEPVLAGVKFSPSRDWKSNWGSLKRAFDGVTLGPAKRRLGIRLFGAGTPEMMRAAQAAFAKPSAASWVQVARQPLDAEQARLAKASAALVQLEAAALNAFGELLRGERMLPAATAKTLKSLATATLDANPFPSSWGDENPLYLAIRGALSKLRRGNGAETVLLGLHLEITRKVRKVDPWMLSLGEEPPGFERWRPGTGTNDFRFGNLRNLLKQTHWRPSAH